MITAPNSSLFGPALRLTLLSSCQSGCRFCHLEGYKSRPEIGFLSPALIGWKTTKEFDNVVSPSDIGRTIAIAKALNIRNVNITGGEPTLFPSLIEVIRELDDAGLSVSVTTHAEIPTKKFAEYLNAGLDWVIVSMHAVTPEQYIEMDLIAQDIAHNHTHADAVRYATGRLANKEANVRHALSAQAAGVIEGLLTNTVMLNVEQTASVIAHCNQLGILPRIQRDLNDRVGSEALLRDLISTLNARREGGQLAAADSSAAGEEYSYVAGQTGHKHRFRLKDFGDVYVPEMCNGCSKRGTESCRERFYGVRIEKGQVRTCIDRTIEGLTVFKQDDFLLDIVKSGTVPHAIARQYAGIEASQNSTERC